jgi:replication-associated recombination protein RarA
MAAKPYKIDVIGGYEFSEVASSLQKCLRRGYEYEASFWVYILHESSYYKYAWKRLLIVASEDVGNGSPEIAQLVHSLQQNYHYCITSVNRGKNDALVFLLQAVMAICRAEKSREADSLANLIRTRYEQGERLEVQSYALDMHTKRGREIHGEWTAGTADDIVERHRKWYDVFSKVKPDVGDRYLDELKKIKGVER